MNPHPPDPAYPDPQEDASVFRLAAAVLFVVIVVALPRGAWGAYAVAALVLTGLAAWSRPPWRTFTRRLLLVEPFVLATALLSLLQPNGVQVFLTMLAKSTLCLACMLWLSGTTPFHEILLVVRRAGFPSLLVTTLALMHRYLFVLVEEAERMRRARQSRTFVAGRLWTWRSLSSVAAHLFVRSAERATRIYMAMCARGWKT